MLQETRVCQNCQKKFTIEGEDFDFYKKIDVPPPTFCPRCRLQRRLAFFNIFKLYQRPCDLCKKETISSYPKEAPYTVYCQKCWWSDKWDFRDYGKDYDFSEPFFEQFNDLLHKVPLIALANDETTNVNSEFNNFSGYLKNCYLLFHADMNENSAYGFDLNHANDTFDSSIMLSDELCYDSMHSYKCSRCIGLRSQVTDSVDCAFLRDSFGCQNCFASANLRNKKYYIFNRPYSKDDYFKEIGKWDLGSYKAYGAVKKMAEEHWKKLPPKPNKDDFSVNCSGSYSCFQSKNCKHCFEVVGAEDSKYLLLLYAPPLKDSYDVSSWGNNMSLFYDCCNCGENSSGLRFSFGSGINLYNGDYCYQSLGGSNQFGSVSARKGNYIILNKPYVEDEYWKMREKIIAQMNELPYTDRNGNIYRYGEFFPPELSPFAYNETIANNFFSLEKEEILAKSWRWHDQELQNYSVTKNSNDLPDHIKDAHDDILKEVVACAKCGRGFRITSMELAFLKKMNLPLPRKCPFCRISEQFNEWVKEFNLVKRTCDKCGAEFETPYRSEDAPYILCKKCYLQESL